MQSALHWTLAAGLVGAWALTASGVPQGDLAQRMSTAGQNFLAALEKEDREDMTYDFHDEERFDLRLAPVLLDGLPLSDMKPEQKDRVHELLAASLSKTGFAKVQTIMSLEREALRLAKQSILRSWFARWIYDPERYFMTIYGDPSNGKPWGYRFDGHHVSLNFTVVNSQVAGAPLFLGAQPHRVPDGWDRAGLQALKSEEFLARALYLSLDEERRQVATIPFQSGRDLFLGEGRQPEIDSPPLGLSRGAMNLGQQHRLDALIDVYFGSLPRESTTVRHNRLEDGPREQIFFAWAGGIEAGSPHYYRVHGPRFLIEFDNSLEEVDHVHLILRDLANDFGRDLLAEHYREKH